jgi:hypothetical protein
MPILCEDGSNDDASVYRRLWPDWVLLNPAGFTYENSSVKW